MKYRNIIVSLAMTALMAVNISCGNTSGNTSREIDDSFLEGVWISCHNYYTDDDDCDSLWTGYATIGFNTAEKESGFYDGCNHWGERYTIDGDSILQFHDPGPSTCMYCTQIYHPGGSGKVEHFNDSFGECLRITSDYGTITYRRPCEWFLQGNWNVVMLTDDFANPGMNADFDIKKHTFTFSDGQSSHTVGYKAADICRIAFDIPEADTADKSHWKLIADLLPQVRGYKLSNGYASVQINLIDSGGFNLLTLERNDPRLELIEDRAFDGE